jgi:transposase
MLRLVAYFNPQLFVDIRRRTAEHCEKLQRHVEQLNANLAAAKRSRKRQATYRKFAHEVERLNYSDLFDIELTPITVTSKTGHSIASFQGSITRDETAWQRRRRYDGFVLLLGHPALAHTASELVNLYRVKDTVEKDFQTIKSVIKLRPLFCYTDPKVQAHVTLCMLALLLERSLEHQLRAAGHPMSAPSCIEELEPCRLNQRQSDDASVYDVTRATALQREILAALDLEHLAADEYLRGRIVPRSLPEPAPAVYKRQRRAQRPAE